MASSVARRKRRKSKPRRPETRQAEPTAPAVVPGQASRATRDSGELPSREALIGRIEHADAAGQHPVAAPLLVLAAG